MKQLTREQIQGRKDQAVRFTALVLEDEARADEIESESLADYADRRGFEMISNPKRRTGAMASKARLEEQVLELEEENSDLQDQLDAIMDIAGPEEEDGEGEDGEEFMEENPAE